MTYFSQQLGQVASEWAYDKIPGEVIWQAKRVLLDSLACIVGAQKFEPATLAADVAEEVKGSGKSTIFGRDGYYPATTAAFVNGVMLRYLDYNDAWLIKVKAEDNSAGGHPSETIPSLLAVSESAGSCGKRFLASIVLAYQMGGVMLRASRIGLQLLGFHYGTWGSYVIPVALSYLLKLPKEATANALGIGGIAGATLGIVDEADELRMAKNTAYPFAAAHAIHAVQLAAKGFTGFLGIFEDKSGLIESVYRGDFTIPKEFVLGGTNYYILDLLQKEIPVQGTTIGHTQCTLDLVREHKFNPEDVKEIHVYAGTRDAVHCGRVERRHPRTKETADHSTYFVHAASIVDREMTPKQYYKLTDQRIYELSEKITVHADPSFDATLTGGRSEITLRDGRVLKKSRPVAHGDARYPIRDPLSDAEIEKKFRAEAQEVMGNELVETIIKTVWRLEEVNNMASFGRMFAAQDRLAFEKR
jgi:2-methylcitrate dehydratase